MLETVGYYIFIGAFLGYGITYVFPTKYFYMEERTILSKTIMGIFWPFFLLCWIFVLFTDAWIEFTEK